RGRAAARSRRGRRLAVGRSPHANRRAGSRRGRSRATAARARTRRTEPVGGAASGRERAVAALSAGALRRRDPDARVAARVAARVDGLGRGDAAAREAADRSAGEGRVARWRALARGARGARRTRAAPDLEQHRPRSRRGRGRHPRRRSLCADESAAHAVAGAEQGALSRCAVRAVLSQCLRGAPSHVPRGRVAAAGRRRRARARARLAAKARAAGRQRRPARLSSCGRGTGEPVDRGGRKVIVDVLIPTYARPTALAVTMTGLCGQTLRPFRVVVSDQTGGGGAIRSAEVTAVARVLETHGCDVELLENLPRRGIAQQRQFLLDQARAPYALCLDDDVILEPYVIELL